MIDDQYCNIEDCPTKEDLDIGQEGDEEEEDMDEQYLNLEEDKDNEEIADEEGKDNEEVVFFILISM